MEAVLEAASEVDATRVDDDALSTLGEFVDSILQAEKMISAVTAWRTELLAAVSQWTALALEHSLDDERLPREWNAATTARRTVSTEIAAALRMPERAVEKLLHEAETLTSDLPRTMDALRSGDIGYRHAQRVVEHATDLEPESRRELDEALHPAASTMTAAQTGQRARILRERLHPESIEIRCREREAERAVYIEPAPDGMAWLSAFLPAERAVAIHSRITNLALAQNTKDEPRTLAQLRADVLSDLLIDGETTERSAGIRATVLVTVPVLTLLGQDMPASLEGYGPIDPETARELAAHAPSFTRLLTHPETSAVLTVGRDSYAVPSDLKTWLRVRDGTCRFPGCRARASSCDIDHTVAWGNLGETEHDNLAHLCRGHHNVKHHTGWRVRQTGNGRLVWSSPTGREYVTEPAGVG